MKKKHVFTDNNNPGSSIDGGDMRNNFMLFQKTAEGPMKLCSLLLRIEQNNRFSCFKSESVFVNKIIINSVQ